MDEFDDYADDAAVWEEEQVFRDREYDDYPEDYPDEEVDYPEDHWFYEDQHLDGYGEM